MYDNNNQALNYVTNSGSDRNFWQNSDQLSEQELKRLQIIVLTRIAVALENIEGLLDERFNNPYRS